MVDEGFSERALSYGSSVIIGGENYGQGSSREHAALVPLYLGVKAVIAKSFARIHVANLINAGIIPLTFKNANDYESVSMGDELVLKNVHSGLKSGEIILENKTNGSQITLLCNFTDRQVDILLSGGLINYTKQNYLNR